MENIVRIVIEIIVVLGIPIGIITGIVKLVRRSTRRSGGTAETVPEERPSLPGTAERVFVYALCFAGLMAVLFAVAGLLAVLMVPVIPGARSLISAHDLQNRISYDLAALIVGAPLWLGLWRLAARRVAAIPAERDTTERRLFLAATFGVTVVVALFGLQEFVQNVLQVNSATDHGPHIRDTIIGAAQVLTYGTAWIFYARFGWRERAADAADWTHDAAVYIASAFALFFLFEGVSGLLTTLINELEGPTRSTFLNSSSGVTWGTWTGPISWAAVGGAASIALHRYDAARAGDRILRVVYEYAMLLWIVPLSLASAGMVVYEFLRRAFGYTEFGTTWNFLADSFPVALTGVALWIFIWSLVRREAVLRTGSTTGVIPYPRRPAIAALSFGGLAAMSTGTVIVLLVVLDALVGTGHSLFAGTWWRDELSSGIAALVIGGAVWAPSWSLLQGAAARQPEIEGTALERRALAGGAGLVASIIALGFGVALLYEVWRTLLGAGEGNALLTVLHDASALCVAVVVALYYGLIFRSDSRRRSAVVAKPRVELRVLLAPGGRQILDGLVADAPAATAYILGYLQSGNDDVISDVDSLRGQIAVLGTPGHADRALLVLGANGGNLYPYTREAAAEQMAPSPTAGSLDLQEGVTVS